METRRFEIPWPGEPQWTPCPHAPPTYLHISLPLVSDCSLFISPSCYTHIHLPPMFFHPQNTPNCIPILPCPLPYHFAFFRSFIAISLLPAPSPTIIYPLILFTKAF